MFFIIWGIVLLLNQLLFFNFCIRFDCIISAVPHTLVISFILYYIINLNKSSTCKCIDCKKENNCNNQFCIYCGVSLENSDLVDSDDEENDSNYNKVLNSKDGILVALLAKVAKSDGKISTIEAKYLSSIYDELCEHQTTVSNIREIYKEILNNEKINLNNINKLCTNYINLNVTKIEKINLIETLVALAYCDDRYDEKEENLIVKIIYNLHIDFSTYKSIVEEYATDNSSDYSSHSQTNHNISIDECYLVLESEKDHTDSDIKKNYRRLVRLYHTDMLSSKDLPIDMIKFAEEKLKLINTAYEKIKKYRGI